MATRVFGEWRWAAPVVVSIDLLPSGDSDCWAVVARACMSGAVGVCTVMGGSGGGGMVIIEW